MILIVGSLIREIQEDRTAEEICLDFKRMASEIAENVVPRQISKVGNTNAQVLAQEILRNVLHGKNAIIEIERHKDGSYLLTTVNRHGKDRLTSYYSPLVEREMPHRGRIMIETIAGKDNHVYLDDGERVFTRTRFSQESILEASRPRCS